MSKNSPLSNDQQTILRKNIFWMQQAAEERGVSLSGGDKGLSKDLSRAKAFGVGSQTAIRLSKALGFKNGGLYSKYVSSKAASMSIPAPRNQYAEYKKGGIKKTSPGFVKFVPETEGKIEITVGKATISVPRNDAEALSTVMKALEGMNNASV